MAVAIMIFCVLALSSCSILKPSPSYTSFQNYGYHFATKAPNGQLLCFIILTGNEVGCVTPNRYYDKETGTVKNYTLTGDVIIPKQVSDGAGIYKVSALCATREHIPNQPAYKPQSKYIAGWGKSCNITNLVIPETVKIIDLGTSPENIIIYGPKNADDITKTYRINVTNSQTAMICPTDQYMKPYLEGNLSAGAHWTHVPSGCCKSKSKTCIETDYDIYADGHSLEEYLVLIQPEIDQKEMMDKYDALDSDFAVRYNKDGILYFIITDQEKKEVKLRNTLNVGDTLVIPSNVVYRNSNYTVTEVTQTRKITFVPETCKKLYIKDNLELICYSPDVKIDGHYFIMHVPQGCVKKYDVMKEPSCLEIVNNYSVYQEGHSAKEYLIMSRNAVDKLMAAKEKARRDAELARQKAYQEKLEKDKETERKARAKYGDKYVDALLRGEMIIGMHEDLFKIGVLNNVFNKVTDAKLDHESAGRKCYKLYGYASYETSTKITFTSSAFVGWVWFKDGKISSIDWL